MTPDVQVFINKAKEAMLQQRLGAQQRSSKMMVTNGDPSSMYNIAAQAQCRQAQGPLEGSKLPTKPPVQQGIERLDQRLDHLLGLIHELTAQLGPVLRAEPKTGEKAAIPPQECLLAEALESASRRVSRASSMIIELRARICI